MHVCHLCTLSVDVVSPQFILWNSSSGAEAVKSGSRGDDSRLVTRHGVLGYGLRWEFGSECLLFAIIVVIMASTGISPMHDPVGVIIAILPRCGSPIVNLVYSSLSRISPTVTLLKASYFLLYTLSPIFFVLCCALRKLVDTVCLCVLRLSGRGGSVKLAAALLGFSGLNWDILSEWHTYLHAVCFFFFSFFSLLATHHSVNHLCINYMQKCSHRCT